MALHYRGGYGVEHITLCGLVFSEDHLTLNLCVKLLPGFRKQIIFTEASLHSNTPDLKLLEG